MRVNNYFPKDYNQATERFLEYAGKYGKVKSYKNEKSKYGVPVLTIGTGPNKIVINTGIHGVEGFFGNAFFIKWLADNNKFLDKRFWKNYTIVFIHIINGYGMDHVVRKNANEVDLNRNFRDWDTPVPVNELYRLSHDLIISKPGWIKFFRMLWHRHKHIKDGVWTAISRGQYEYPTGIFYGGNELQPEYFIVEQIYDDVMSDPDVKSLLSIGLHTGLGEYKKPTILVSHPTGHPNVTKFKEIFEPEIDVVPDEKGQVNAAELSGDLVDWLEVKYAPLNIPIWTADIEMGTGTSRMSPVLKRMDEGDAQWEKMHRGVISKRTKLHLSEDWAPRDKKWRTRAIGLADVFADKLYNYMEKQNEKSS